MWIAIFLWLFPSLVTNSTVQKNQEFSINFRYNEENQLIEETHSNGDRFVYVRNKKGEVLNKQSIPSGRRPNLQEFLSITGFYRRVFNTFDREGNLNYIRYNLIDPPKDPLFDRPDFIPLRFSVKIDPRLGGEDKVAMHCRNREEIEVVGWDNVPEGFELDYADPKKKKGRVVFVVARATPGYWNSSKAGRDISRNARSFTINVKVTGEPKPLPIRSELDFLISTPLEINPSSLTLGEIPINAKKQEKIAIECKDTGQTVVVSDIKAEGPQADHLHWELKEIEPGKIYFIELEIDESSPQGIFNATLTYKTKLSDEAEAQPHGCLIHAVVGKIGPARGRENKPAAKTHKVEVMQGSIYFVSKRGLPSTLKRELRNADETPLRIKAATVKATVGPQNPFEKDKPTTDVSESFTATVKPVQEGESYQLELAFNGGSNPGKITGEILLELEEGETVPVAFSGSIHPPFKIEELQSITNTMQSVSRPRPLVAIVKSEIPNKKVKVDQLKLEMSKGSQFFTTRLAHDEKTKSCRIELVVKPECPQGQYSGKIKFRVTVDDYEDLQEYTVSLRRIP